MITSVPFAQEISAYVFQPFLLNFLSPEQTKQIKQIAITVFSRISEFFKSFKSINSQPKEINIKAIAMIGCLSLIALLVISMLRCRDVQFVPPPTPLKKDAS
jgi:hypothetical protein